MLHLNVPKLSSFPKNGKIGPHNSVTTLMKMARVNQHPPVHQLAILSIGWAAFFHPVPDSLSTQHCTTVNLFGLLTFDTFFFWGVFFPMLTILSSNLITLVA
jgi:hypothetical protein